MPIPRAVPLDRAPRAPLRPEPLLTEEVQRLSKEREQVLEIVGLRRGRRHVSPPPPYSEQTALFTWNERLLCWTRSAGEKDTSGGWEAWDMQASCWVDGPMYEKNRHAMTEIAERLAHGRTV